MYTEKVETPIKDRRKFEWREEYNQKLAPEYLTKIQTRCEDETVVLWPLQTLHMLMYSASEWHETTM